jgi:hypothetical protein
MVNKMNNQEKTLYSLFKEEGVVPDKKLMEAHQESTLLQVIDRPDIAESVVSRVHVKPIYPHT